MQERQKHLDAFEYFIELGATATDANMEKVGVKCGVNPKTAWRWYKVFKWRDRAIIRLSQAKKKLEEEGILDTSAELASFLTLCQEKVAESKAAASYFRAALSTAKEQLEAGELKIKTPRDMESIAKAISMQDKSTQDWIKTALLLMGEPDSRPDMGVAIQLIEIDEKTFPKAIPAEDEDGE